VSAEEFLTKFCEGVVRASDAPILGVREILTKFAKRYHAKVCLDRVR
jgi:hypothetical protein